jgi:ribosomal protein L14
MLRVDRRRAEITALIRVTTREATMRGKQVKTVDPLVIRANRMYPYLPEGTILDYARTALKIITNGDRPHTTAQTTLTAHFA